MFLVFTIPSSNTKVSSFDQFLETFLQMPEPDRIFHPEEDPVFFFLSPDNHTRSINTKQVQGNRKG